MNWINPRDRLPEVGQLFWALCIESPGSDNTYPVTGIVLCLSEIYQLDYIGRCITTKGLAHGSIKTFFHMNENINPYWGETIAAWLPYDGLPEFHNHMPLKNYKTKYCTCGDADCKIYPETQKM